MMKHRVERDLTSNGWVVLDPDGDVVYTTNVWAWALDDAIARHNTARRDAIVSRAYD